jgi:hypothetical protein
LANFDASMEWKGGGGLVAIHHIFTYSHILMVTLLSCMPTAPQNHSNFCQEHHFCELCKRAPTGEVHELGEAENEGENGRSRGL